MKENDLTGAVNSAAAESKIDKATAENEFNTYCENNGIENNTAEMDEEKLDLFKDIKNRFIKACMAGRVEVDGRSIKYKVSEFSPDGFKGEILKMTRPAGQAFAAMDDYKDNQRQKQSMAFISAMTGKDVGYFKKIDIVDYRFLSDVVNLFLSFLGRQ